MIGYLSVYMIRIGSVVMKKNKSMFGKRANGVHEVWQEVKKEEFSA